MDNRVRIGVVGAGVFGNYHANKCADNPWIDFIGVYDSHISRAQSAAQKHDVKAFQNYQDMLAQSDAVIIACGASQHGVMAIDALKAGLHCLIEKPLAATLEDAAQILTLSQTGKRIVQTGHQERFVAKAIGLEAVPETPKFIKANRIGRESARGTDVSVTLDLMTHDLDLVLWLMGRQPQKITSQTQKVYSPYSDITEARLDFADGYAELIASRAADAFRRTMEIVYPSGTVHIDFNTKTLQHDTPFDLDTNFAAKPMASDSLGAATESFVASILQDAPIIVTAQDGYNALKLALDIDAIGKDGDGYEKDA